MKNLLLLNSMFMYMLFLFMSKNRGKSDLFFLRSNFLECTINLDYKKGIL